MADSLFARSLRIFLVVCAYWTVSISLVFLNKYLLSSKELKLEAPLFVTWFQCITCVVVLFFLSFLGDKYPKIDKFPAFKIDFEICKQVLPLSFMFVGMITANNLCLKFLDVAFYNVARAFTTFFNVVFSYILLGQKTSLRAICCCGIIILGFAMGVKEESKLVNLSYKGVLFGVIGSSFVSLNAIFTKRTMPAVDGNIWRLQLYNNFNAIFLFIPLMVFTGEVSIVRSFNHLTDLYFWGMMVLSGIVGISIGYVTGLQIKVTSPLTHNISGSSKGGAQTIIAVLYYHTVKSGLWWICNILVLGGSALYTYVKHGDMKKQFEAERKEVNANDEKV